ncbi:hypothetical protein DGI_3425 [Megalodesulfovibrio gigas DSM 1382 = ATCC 19364]|uniref:Uncharacterized protein n=1 Tax=Megalodesulfovibrio gigas (strain ATCC 19364 / DSM 1382 / NCIMB 9332 / VKM B-1759) TaxID=1121448 RepID=T2GEV9_MEGG1|nr:hypothetical protein DGI_3425 [Megalodesulfovibrio gigas DSM 1382 = ATCC 19364]
MFRMQAGGVEQLMHAATRAQAQPPWDVHCEGACMA